MQINQILEQFIYSEDKVPKNYGEIFTLTEFINKLEHNHCQEFMGTGYLIFNEKLVENSKDWISDRFITINNESISLTALNELMKDLKVFWISETDLLF